MAYNPLFEQAMYFKTSARQRRGRIDLLAKDVAKELNTYANFGIFKTYNDVDSPTWLKENDDKGENEPKSTTKGGGKKTVTTTITTTNSKVVNGRQIEPYQDDPSAPANGTNKPGTPGVRSLFNRYSAVVTGDDSEDGGQWSQQPMWKAVRQKVRNASSFRAGQNVPLLDTPENRKKIRELSGCSVRELVNASAAGLLGRQTYSYADFMFCKYLGRVSNNYLITLRRFPTPVTDTITPIGRGKVRKRGSRADTFFSEGTMVTWLGVSGNDMKNILKYNYHMAFEEKQAQWEDVTKEGGDSGMLNGLEAMFNPTARKLYNGGTTVPALDNFMGSLFGTGGGAYSQRTGHEDKNKVYGPIDRVKKAYARSESGLDWDHKFTLVFEYELKAYNGINPRQAMLDLIASILATTYTTGGFWPGGYRGGGVRQSSAFTNLNIFKCRGGFTDFMDAFSKDIRNGAQAFMSKLKNDYGGSLIEMAKAALNAIGGMLMGGMLNKLGRPARYFANSLISDAPVGLWHITIGNPYHPIMSMGNMILKDTQIEHYGPLGLDDFPTGLRVTCQFDRGKPRDQLATEQLYMAGNDRIFHSMSSKIADMYKVAKEYKSNPAGPKTVSSVAITDEPADVETVLTETTTIVTKTKKMVPEGDASGSGENKDTEKKTEGQKETEKKAEEAKEAKTEPELPRQLTVNEVSVLGIMRHYFGDGDPITMVTSSEEQAEGAFKKAPVEMPAKTNDGNANAQQGQGDQTPADGDSAKKTDQKSTGTSQKSGTTK